MKWRVCSAIAMVLHMTSAQASLTLHIQQTLEKGIDVGVASFSGPTAGEPLGDIIRQDLHHGPGLRVAPQVVSAWQPGVIAFSDTDVSAGAESQSVTIKQSAAQSPPQYIVQGFVQQIAPQRFHFSYALVEPATQRVLLSGQLKAGDGRWRAVAHYISDAIYKKLTGVPGLASRQLAYVQVQPGSQYQLMLADSDGVNARTILQSVNPILSPSWSPDGQTIAYVSFEDGQSAIYNQNIRTGERTRLTASTGTSAAPSWSSDGQRLAMALSAAGNTDIYLYRLSDGDLQRVTEHPAIDTEPRWSADSQSLLFTSDRSGRAQIYRLDLASNQAQRVSFSGRFNARVALDPTSDAIATIHDSGDGRYRLALLEKGRAPWFLSDAALASSPSFASNGLLLTYTEQTTSGDRIAFVSRDGLLRWQWPEQLGTVREAVWSPK